MIIINELFGLYEGKSDYITPEDYRVIIVAYTTTVRKPIIKGKNNRLFCSISPNYLHSFFQLRFVRKEVPSNCKFNAPPIITYKYGRAIGQAILNCKTDLQYIN